MIYVKERVMKVEGKTGQFMEQASRRVGKT